MGKAWATEGKPDYRHRATVEQALHKFIEAMDLLRPLLDPPEGR